MPNRHQIAQSLLALAESNEPKELRARKIANAICGYANHRAVCIYAVVGDELVLLGWSGEDAPITRRMSLSQGLNGAAVRSRETIVVNDVEADPRYLPTFSTTMSEVIVPVTDPLSDNIVATIDIENGSKDAFSDDDVLLLEMCGWAIAPLWR